MQMIIQNLVAEKSPIKICKTKNKQTNNFWARFRCVVCKLEKKTGLLTRNEGILEANRN